jgi:predicted nucleic acid-binding protein
MNYYFDTCIWRDYYENRNDNYRPLGEWALALIKKIQKEEGIIFYSELVIDELKKEYTPETIKKIINIPYIKLIDLNFTQSQIQEATILGKIRRVGFSDAFHAILARDNNAMLITRDVHFYELRDIVKIKKPEELI